jgi:hypothetical protein
MIYVSSCPHQNSEFRQYFGNKNGPLPLLTLFFVISQVRLHQTYAKRPSVCGGHQVSKWDFIFFIVINLVLGQHGIYCPVLFTTLWISKMMNMLRRKQPFLNFTRLFPCCLKSDFFIFILSHY